MVAAKAPISAPKFSRNPTVLLFVPLIRSKAATFQMSLSLDAGTLPSLVGRSCDPGLVMISVAM